MVEERVADAAEALAGAGDVGGCRLAGIDRIAQLARGHHAVAFELGDLLALLVADAIERRDLIAGQRDGDADLRVVPPVAGRHHVQTVGGATAAGALESAASRIVSGITAGTAAGVVRVRGAGYESQRDEREKESVSDSHALHGCHLRRLLQSVETVVGPLS